MDLRANRMGFKTRVLLTALNPNPASFRTVSHRSLGGLLSLLNLVHNLGLIRTSASWTAEALQKDGIAFICEWKTKNDRTPMHSLPKPRLVVIDSCLG